MPWMFERATRLWAMSPTMATLSPSKWPFLLRMVSRSSSACVGCSCAPSPALTIAQESSRASSAGAPDDEWRTTTTFGLMAAMLRAVSTNDSPLAALEPDAAKLMTSADSHLPAISNDVRVRVEFS